MRAVCGLDVHKDSVFLCILNEDGELIERVFGVLTFHQRQRPASSRKPAFFSQSYCLIKFTYELH